MIMKKEENKNLLAVIPTDELLSELESMVVFGGMGVGMVEGNSCPNFNCPSNNYSNCGVKCSTSCDTDATHGCSTKYTTVCNSKYSSGCFSKGLTCIDTGAKLKIPCD